MVHILLRAMMVLAAVVRTGIAMGQDDGGLTITSHRARIELSPSHSSVSVLDTVTVRPGNRRTDVILLRLSPLYDIKLLSVKGKSIEFKRTPDGVLVEDIPADTSVDIILWYVTRGNFRSGFSMLSESRAILKEEDVLPFGRRSFTFVRLSLVVPSHWETVTVGTRVASHTTENTTTHVWELEQPAPIVGWICAGTYAKYERVTRVNGVVSIAAYLFDEDSARAGEIIGRARDVIGWYSRMFTPYRFPRMSIVEIEDWVGGPGLLAIAAPSFVMVKSQAFTTDDPFNRAGTILPHEIAHQWWPATVYVEEFEAPFLAEGMCEYSSLLYNEGQPKKTSRDSLSHHPFLRPLVVRVQKGKDIPLRRRADMRSYYTHYLKATFVHHMLRKIMGEETFLKLYREFALRFAERMASLDDFRMLAEELSGRKLDWFFSQWVEQVGVPRLKLYNVRAAPDGEAWVVRGRVRIVGYDQYTVRVDVGAETGGTMETATVWLGTDSTGAYRNDVPFELHTSGRPLRVRLDPAGDVLKIQKLPAKFSDLREPSDGLFVVGTQGNAGHLLALARKDSAELTRGGWSIRIKHDTAVTLGDLQNEMVFLYGKVESNRVATEQRSKFPLVFRNDSVVVNGEVVFDSTLALLQAIENPFNAQGLMLWIAPLSYEADPSIAAFDASWVLVRGRDEITSGTWPVRDEDLVVDLQ